LRLRLGCVAQTDAHRLQAARPLVMGEGRSARHGARV
jgi:hypothetical protein